MLLERAGARGELEAATGVLRQGRGRAVFVHGEAGIGKSSLLRDFSDDLRTDCRVLVGSCDDLVVPRPLGAVLDALGPLDGLAAAVSGSPDPARRLYDVLAGTPTTLVLEDVQWADEATLDVLSFLLRRIRDLPLLLVLSYRDDEVPADHPLHRTLAAAPSTHTRRVGLSVLSLDAVRRLAGTEVDPETVRLVHQVTGGNPFFVSEALASGVERTPGTVRDAVLARFARLPPAARATAELVCVVPGRAEAWLVEACLGEEADVATCEAQGLLLVDRVGIRFRHELARWAVEEVLPGGRRRSHHRAVLDALVAAGAPSARLAHHAWHAGDAAAVVRHGMAAAEEAADARSHREAAQLLARVLEHESLLPVPARADALDLLSREAYAAGQAARALTARERAVELRAGLGDPRATSESLRWLSRLLWWTRDPGRAEAVGEQAVEVLAGLPPCREQAMALSNRSQLAMLAQRDDEAIALGRRAIGVARRVGDPAPAVHALVNIGSAVARTDLSEGLALLEEAAVTGLESGIVEDACRAFTNAAWQCQQAHRNAQARALAARAREVALGHQLQVYLDYLDALEALLLLREGRWDASMALVRGVRHVVEEEPSPVRADLMLALEVLGLLCVRRREADADDVLDRAWGLAVAAGELQRTRPVACARAEAAWLLGDLARVEQATGEVYRTALERGTAWDVGELAVWRHRAGALGDPPTYLPEPFDLELRGEPVAAARVWSRWGEPYAAALSLLCSSRVRDVREGLTILDGLGAAGALPRARARLRELGSVRVPRGRSQSTRGNPAGLTDRQLEVLGLVARGLTNAEIAHQLVLSPKTVEHHVGALLTKLDVSTRGQAAVVAEQLVAQE